MILQISFRKLPLSAWWSILKETFSVYYLSVVNREKAIEEIGKDEEIIKAFMEQLATMQSDKTTESNDENNNNNNKNVPDLQSILDKLRNQNPKLFDDFKSVGSVEDAIKFAKENRAGIF